ncbi:MAG: hypothetical protein CL920_06015 [Deltaproteobacteria bacterium]|nr:hypothetical protein [Deltaproteobacteria bacterium]MBU48234.1 hypothetical protein [Deltaproteobacteria bacterium]|tara:strand:+ start:44 stop:886 length:843 start_codon:yes stop_codon:yes gene_type:complete
MTEIAKALEGINMSQGIITMGLLMSRIMGMIFLAPFLGGKLVPNQVKIGVGVTLSLIIQPVVQATGGIGPILNPTGPSYPFAIAIVGYLVKEVFVGFVLGFIIHTIWHAAEMIGRFVDTARGSAMGTALVPTMKSSSSVFGSFYYQLLILLFLLMDGHLLFINFFVRSYVHIPISSIPRFDTGLWPFVDMMIRITADLFTTALAFSAPVMIAIFITDVCMGLFNKVAPQINVLFLMMPFKAVLGVLFSMLAFFLFVRQSEYLMAQALHHVWEAIRHLTPF